VSSAGEGVRGADLVLASEAPLIAFAILSNVKGVGLLKLLAVLNYDVIAAWGSASGLGAVVGVPTSPVPVSGDGLRVKADLHVEHLRNAVQNVPAFSSPLPRSTPRIIY
jgi:hypothetical protein